jgi:uncharacterized membrane protein
MQATGIDIVAPWRRQFSVIVTRGFSRFTDWLLRHWLGLLNWVLGTLLAVALLTPVLAYFGVEPLAGQIFRTYHAICDQIPSHSFFILGHQMAFCARNFSLYGSFWLGTMVFRFVRHRLRPLKWYYLILFLLPMALDGGTQLFGWRESTNLLRVITGVLFGLGLAWFALPFVEDAVVETLPALVASEHDADATNR